MDAGDRGGGTERTLLVCVNVDCEERGSPDVLAALIERRDLRVDVREYICFSACEKGPNVVCVEDQVWYCGVQPEDVDEIVSALAAGETVERLTQGTDKITRNLIFSILEAGLLPGDV
ncbi:MAG: (2Fe-2S) ferredoxin domain-containing protein, partial [Acidimicrobiia bacterium]